MSTKRPSLEDEYYRYFREEAESRHDPAPEGDAQADAVERRHLLEEIAAEGGRARCPGCGTALAAGALKAGGEGCPACAGRSLREGASPPETGKRSIRRKLIDFFFL